MKLKPPRLDRGLTVMRTLEAMASATEFDGRRLEMMDLSDLLWVTNGMNRHCNGKRTASSAMNVQGNGVYLLLYNVPEHQLEPMTTGGFRSLTTGPQEKNAMAPAICLLASDI